MLSDELRTAIEESGRSIYGLAVESGVSRGIINRFLHNERDIRLASAERIAAVLGLALRPIESPKTPPPAPSKGKAKRKKS